jgi:hypothetical protein
LCACWGLDAGLRSLRDGGRSCDPDCWRSQSAAAWHPALIGEVDVDDDLVTVGGKVVQHQLRPSEHTEGLTVYGAPGEVDKPLAPLPLHGRTTKVAVMTSDLDNPLRLSRIRGDPLDRLAVHLETDMDVRVGATLQTG